MISESVLDGAVRRFCPVFYLCDDDAFGHPCSFDFFIQQSKLICSECSRVLVDVGDLTPEYLRDALCEECGHGEKLSLQLAHPEAKFGERACKIDDIPVYAHVKGILDEGGESFEALEITYITLFAHNGPYTVCPFILDVGAHDGDIEHITVRVDPTGSKLMGIWYNAHRNHDGSWVSGSEVETTREGRVLSFVAKHGHGHYARDSVFFRHFFLGNDVTKREIRWSPKNVVMLPTFDVDDDGGVVLHHRPPSKGSSLPADGTLHDGCMEVACPNLIKTDPCHWMQFRGFYGTAPAPRSQTWFHEAEPPLSRHPLLRLFFHFWPETVSLR